MKILSTLSVSLLLVAMASGTTTFIAAGRMIHLRTIDEDGGSRSQKDSYIRARAIDLVEIHESKDSNDDKGEITVRIVTRMTKFIHLYNGTSLAPNIDYEINCATRAEAEKVLAAIKLAISEREKEGEAEQAGTGQPATRPKSKSEGSDKPQPESEGRSR